MKTKYIIGNWKSNKTVSEVKEWFRTSEEIYSQRSTTLVNCKIVICPSIIHLPLAHELISTLKIPLQLGAQDISPFPSGAYTGEVSSAQIVEFARYVLIGHSERRKYFSESDEILEKKVNQSQASGLKSIYCVESEKSYIPKSVICVAFEPLFAIGTGITATPESADIIAAQLKSLNNQVETVIYGGSVTANNVSSFLEMKHLDGVLPGGASLDPYHFWEIVYAAEKIQT